MWTQEMIDSHNQRHESLRAMFEETLYRYRKDCEDLNEALGPTEYKDRLEKINKVQAVLLDTFNKSDESACRMFLKLMEAEPRYYLVYFYDDGGAVDHTGEMTPEEAIRTAEGRRIRFFQEINKYDLRGKTDEERGVRVEANG